MFSLEMTNAKPMNLILTSPDTAYGLYNINTDVNIYVSNVSLFFHINIQAVLPPSICLGAVWVDVCRALKGK